MILDPSTQNHFNQIANTWSQKGWVNDAGFNSTLAAFISDTEKKLRLDQKQHKSLLYVGIGTGALFQWLQKYHIAGVDQAFTMLEQCPEGIIQINAPGNDLPFLMPNQFHLGLSRNLLKHCQDPYEVIREMYGKLRKGSSVICFESVVFKKEDSAVPTELVRLTDPIHPPFLTIDQVVALYDHAGFRDIQYQIFLFRDTWLKKWIKAEQADEEVQKDALSLYQRNQRYRKIYDVVLHDEDITSTVPWIMLAARK